MTAPFFMSRGVLRDLGFVSGFVDETEAGLTPTAQAQAQAKVKKHKRKQEEKHKH